MILSFAWFAAVLIWDLLTDYRKWLRNKTVRHSWEAVIRAALLTPSVYGIADSLPLHWGYNYAMTCTYLFFLWWLLFDGFYNILRGYSWWFNSSLDGARKDSKLDLFLATKPDWQEACIKILPLVILTIVYFRLK